MPWVASSSKPCFSSFAARSTTRSLSEYTYIINTTAGRQAIEDSKLIRRSALQYKVHYDTTLNGGFATAMALNADATEKVISVQEMHAQIKG